MPIYRVPSSPEEAALLPLGSYSSYRLLGKMYKRNEIANFN